MDLELKIEIVPATIADYPTVQNLARFYVYDQSRYCGFISKDWAMPADGLYECFDFKSYFEEPSRKALLIKVDSELAGFVLLNKVPISPAAEHNIGEFFIVAKFQEVGISTKVAHQIWRMYPGSWEVSVIPENKRALSFWRKTISSFTGEHYDEKMKMVDYDKDQPRRYVFNFDALVMPEIINTKQEVIVSSACQDDIAAMVALSYQKRRDYEQAQPQFWRYAAGAEKSQSEWFKELLTKDEYIMLVAKRSDAFLGFIIGGIVKAPEVYDPGLTLVVDDFCVSSSVEWQEVGGSLIAKLKELAKSKDAEQIVVVAGKHDQPKRRFLQEQSLAVASEWYVGEII